MRRFALLTLCLAATLSAQEIPVQNVSPAQLVPADKGVSKAQVVELRQRGRQRAYRNDARTTIGMPCGGICAGQLYVLGDGTLGCWALDGNTYFGGVGHTSYDTYRPARPIAQGFAIAVRAVDGAVTRATLDDAGYDAIEFVGEYPRALVRYRTKDKTVPRVDVDLEVFSPFVPLSARDSAWPATVLRFSVKNTSDVLAEVALGGWLENHVFADQRSPLTTRRRNRAVGDNGVTTVLMDAVERRPPLPAGPAVKRVLADFESGT